MGMRSREGFDDQFAGHLDTCTSLHQTEGMARLEHEATAPLVTTTFGAAEQRDALRLAGQ
jgi:hypothetical protein